ncbi:hypothetical protein CKO27_16725 [Thiocystis violacea]|nr:hypothetical protein [Thiocystis violacea]
MQYIVHLVVFEIIWVAMKIAYIFKFRIKVIHKFFFNGKRFLLWSHGFWFSRGRCINVSQ